MMGTIVFSVGYGHGGSRMVVIYASQSEMHVERLIGHLFAVLLLRTCFGCNVVGGFMRWADICGASIVCAIQHKSKQKGFKAGGFSA